MLGKKFYRGRGCAACNNTGFKGRTGLFELMPMNDQLRDLINRGASTDKLRDLALQHRHGPAARRPAWRRSSTASPRIEEVIRETVSEA